MPAVRPAWPLSIVLVAALLAPAVARAHCDGLDGPVVKAARAALESGDPRPALAWVRPGDEPEIRAAFRSTLAARKLGPDARTVADTWFFETLVRVHRAGEGAPYTGLKPAGRDLGPAVPAADRALATGDVASLLKLLAETTRDRVRDAFARVVAAKPPPGGDVEAGRRWVEAYVAYVHLVERIHDAAVGPAAHLAEGEARPAVHHAE